LQFSLQPENLAYYRDLLGFLGWQTWYDTAEMVGMGNPSGGTSLWFAGSCNEVKNDYDGAGFNHLGLSVPNQVDVDAAVDYLRNNQVMFETPDRILLEVVYIGPKA
jgi:catechol 2,3-dioxygenase-like lactoylglutathione lyase family enzyme